MLDGLQRFVRMVERETKAMRLKQLCTIALSAGILAGAEGAANAKDWIENVLVERNGIDVVSVEVSADANGYTAIKSKNHRFLLRLYARATNGERIVAGKLGMSQATQYFEGSGSAWNLRLDGREMYSGSRRTVDKSVTPVIPTSSINWHMVNPVGACSALLSGKVAAGQSRTAVLAREWNTTVNVMFTFDAVAAHKKQAENGKWDIKNTTSERDSFIYPVNVTCLPGIKRKAS